MPLTTVAPTITAAGISAPTYDEILQFLKDQYTSIFGSDAYLGADSQDGQMLAVFARAQADTNDAMIAAVNGFSPSDAQGALLSRLVKINGIGRKVATFSQAPGLVGGVSGTVIIGGIVSDANGNRWHLPAQVDIPDAGEVAVTLTAEDPGAIVATTGTISVIKTPVYGWQTVTNTGDAVPGQPVETDAALRIGQRSAASLPSIGPLAGILTAVERLNGVTRAKAFENSTGAVDANGLPAHSVSVIVEGGDLVQIATAIGQKKGVGPATYGTTIVPYVDPVTGDAYNINFYILTYTAILVTVTLDDLSGWASDTEAAIQQAVADHINGLAIGEDVEYTRMWAPAYLNGNPLQKTYKITALTVNAGVIDVAVPFNKAAKMQPADVTIVVNP